MMECDFALRALANVEVHHISVSFYLLEPPHKTPCVLLGTNFMSSGSDKKTADHAPSVNLGFGQFNVTTSQSQSHVL